MMWRHGGASDHHRSHLAQILQPTAAYDLFRVQKQMLALAVYYEVMQKTGQRPTDRFATQDDALIYASEVVHVSSRTVRRWRDDFQINNRRFTER